MQTNLTRVWIATAALASLMVASGCKDNVSHLGVPVFAQLAPATTQTPTPAPPSPPAPAPTPAEAAEAVPQQPSIPNPVPGSPGGSSATDTNRLLAAPAHLPPTPENISISSGLEDILRLAQAGISEEVMLTYIANSTNTYNLTSNEIVYLNDMGISSAVIKSLIEMDRSPQAQARRKTAAAVTPLPPGVALAEPATNIYPATTPKSEIVQVPKVPENVDYGTPYSELPAATQPVAEIESYTPVEGEEQPAEVSYFYSGLAPYGHWYRTPEYGYCWRPTVAVANYNWRPYRDAGRWLWSSSGWYWYSDYTWGWAPFHYGRWASYPRLGWIWVPDTVWGPSWVSWRSSRYYCGWAPLPPRSYYVSGFGLYYNNGSVAVNFGFGYDSSCYNFIPLNRFTDHRPYHYYASSSHCKAIYNDSTVINNYIDGDNNTIVNQGIGYDPVAQATRSAIPTVNVRDAAGSIDAQGRRERLVSSGDSVSVTRPVPPPQRVQPQSGEAGMAARPANFPESNASIPPGRTQAGRLQEAQPDRATRFTSIPSSTAEATPVGPSLPSSPTDARGHSRKPDATRPETVDSRQPILIDRNTVQAERNGAAIPPGPSQPRSDGRPSAIIIRRGTTTYAPNPEPANDASSTFDGASSSRNFGTYPRPTSSPNSQRVITPSPQSSLTPQPRPSRSYTQPRNNPAQPTRSPVPQPSRSYSQPTPRAQPSAAPPPSSSGMRFRSMAQPSPSPSMAPAPRTPPPQRQAAPPPQRQAAPPPSRPAPQAAPAPRSAPAPRQAPSPSPGNSGGSSRGRK